VYISIEEYLTITNSEMPHCDGMRDAEVCEIAVLSSDPPNEGAGFGVGSKRAGGMGGSKRKKWHAALVPTPICAAEEGRGAEV